MSAQRVERVNLSDLLESLTFLVEEKILPFLDGRSLYRLAVTSKVRAALKMDARLSADSCPLRLY
jgi:hypothetical protein